MLDNKALEAILMQISEELTTRRWMLATAESCTGGLIAAACTSLAGSSDWFERGFITYSNEAKAELLGIAPSLITAHGAVSEPVARAMAIGAVAHAHVQVGIAITGVAGPDGGSEDKPVGTVWFAWHVAGHTHSEMQRFGGDRAAIRSAAVHWACLGLQALLKDSSAACH